MTKWLAGCVGLALAAGAPLWAAADEGIEAVTKPSADVTLAFVRPGRISEVRVKEGDAVKEGDILLRLEDEAEQIQLGQLKAQADDTIRIRAAEKQVLQKQEDLKKLEWAGKEGAATEWEIEHARLEVVIGDLSTDLAKFNQTQDRLKYDEAKAQLDRMRIISPISGKVEQLFLHKGESAEALAKVVRVVKTDILWADAPVPLVLARRLKVGGAAQVVFPETEGKAVEAKVIFMAGVADAASETLIVRVEVQNPGTRPAGERVRVRFPGAGDPAPAKKP
jgi:RND family efflux transporter MFP subunit